MQEKIIYDAGEFESSPADALRMVRERGEVIQITDGESEPMLLLRADREVLGRVLDEMEVLEKLRQGLDDIRAGRTRPVEEVIAELRSSLHNR